MSNNLMRDFDHNDFPEDDRIEISDLDTPERHTVSWLVYRICNALIRQYYVLKRVREIYRSPRARIIFFVLILLIAGSVLSYQFAVSLRPKTTSVTYSTLQIINISATTTNFSISHGIVYICTPDGTLSAHRASDGTLLWQSKASIPLAQPVMVNNMLYLASEDSRGGHVDAFRASDGRLQWSYQTQAFNSQSFMVADGTVYIHTQNGMLEALRASDGKVLWQLMDNLPQPLQTLLFTSNGVTALRVNAYTVYLLRAQDGFQLLRYAFNNNFAWQPEIEGGIAYIYAGQNVVQVYRLSDRKLLWRYVNSGGASSWTFIIQHGIFYVNTGSTSLKALNAQNGTQLWQYEVKDGMSDWSPENKTVLFTSANGVLEALSASHGSLLWKFEPPDSNVFWNSAIAGKYIHVIVYAPSAIFYTLRASDGRMVTHQPLNAFNESYVPVIIDNVLYTQQYNGSIDAWRSSDGKHLWNYRLSEPINWNLAGDSGLLYLQQVDGTLIVIRTRDGKMVWRYPVP